MRTLALLLLDPSVIAFLKAKRPVKVSADIGTSAGQSQTAVLAEDVPMKTDVEHTLSEYLPTDSELKGSICNYLNKNNTCFHKTAAVNFVMLWTFLVICFL